MRIEKRDSPLAKKICCNKFIINTLIKNPTGVEVGSFSCNNPTIFKVELWRKWLFFRFFRYFRKMIVFLLDKLPISCYSNLLIQEAKSILNP